MRVGNLNEFASASLSTEMHDRPEGCGRERLSREAWVFCALLALTILAMWPVVPITRMASELHYGDATINAYCNSWCADAWWRHPLHYFDAPFFYPRAHSLTSMEPQLVPAILSAPIWVLTRNAVLSYNVLLYLSTFTALLAGYWVLRAILPVGRAAAVLGAVFFAINSDRYWHLSGHLDLIWSGFLPVLFYCAWRMMLRPSLRILWITALAWGLSIWTSWYWLVFGGCALLGGALAVFCVQRFTRRAFWRGVLVMGAAAFCAAILVLPMANLYMRGRVSSHARQRGSMRETEALAATLEGWIFPPHIPERQATAWGLALPPRPTHDEDSQFIGYLLLAVLLGEAVRLASAYAKRNRSVEEELQGEITDEGGQGKAIDKLSLLCLAMALVCAALSLGPIIMGHHGPYYYLHLLVLEHTRFFRNPARFAFLFQWFSAVSAAVFLSMILPKRERMAGVVAGVLILIVLAEHWPVIDSARYVPPRYSALAELNCIDSARRQAFVALPDPGNCLAGLSTAGAWRPMLNGFPHSALFSWEYDPLMRHVAKFPGGDSLALLSRNGVQWVVITDNDLLVKARHDQRVQVVYQGEDSALARVNAIAP